MWPFANDAAFKLFQEKDPKKHTDALPCKWQDEFVAGRKIDNCLLSRQTRYTFDLRTGSLTSSPICAVDVVSCAVAISIIFCVLGGRIFRRNAEFLFSRLWGMGNLYLIIGIAVLCMSPLVTLPIKLLNYRNTVYRVYSDRLQIEEGFLTLHCKDILISSIREISLRRGILQRLVGLGSIYLATPATGQGPWWQSSAIIGGTSTFGSGAMLMDLAKFEVAYQQLRDLADARKPQISDRQRKPLRASDPI